MAQALETVNMSPNLGKIFSFAQKLVILFQNSVLDEIQFSQKSLTDRKKQPLTLSPQVLVQQNPIISCCYYKPPRSWPPEKETKILETGARLSKMKSQYQTFQTRYS